MKNSLYVYIEDHVKLLVLSFFLGIALAALYDVFRITRSFLGCGLVIGETYRKRELPLVGAMKRPMRSELTGKFKGILLVILDILYSILFTVTVLVFFYYTTDGIVRWFSLSALALGFLFYMKTVGVVTKRTAETFLFLLITLFRYLSYFTVRPIRSIVLKIKQTALYVCGKTVLPWTKKLLYKRSNKKITEYTENKLQKELRELTRRVFGQE